jgi:hypothetical protein
MESQYWYINRFNFIGENGKMYLGRICLVSFILIGASLFSSILQIMTIVGSISGTIIQVILPVIMYNKAYENSPRKQW